MSDPLAVPQADIGAALTDMWRSVLLFVPKALAFIAILIIGFFVAKFVLKVVDRVLERVGFDRAVERSGLGRTLARARYDASDILARLAYYTVLLFTLQLAFGVWGPNAISDLISAVISWLPRAFVAILIIVVAAAIAAAVRDLITGALGGLSYGRLIANVVSIFIIALGVIAALNQVGIATTVTQPVLVAVLATVAGILIVGVGGGLVRPMQRRWEGWLDRMATESAVIRERAKAYQAERAEEERRKVEEERRRADESAAAAAAPQRRPPRPFRAASTGSPNPPAPAYPPAQPTDPAAAQRRDRGRADAGDPAGGHRGGVRTAGRWRRPGGRRDAAARGDAGDAGGRRRRCDLPEWQRADPVRGRDRSGEDAGGGERRDAGDQASGVRRAVSSAAAGVASLVEVALAGAGRLAAHRVVGEDHHGEQHGYDNAEHPRVVGQQAGRHRRLDGEQQEAEPSKAALAHGEETGGGLVHPESLPGMPTRAVSRSADLRACPVWTATCA